MRKERIRSRKSETRNTHGNETEYETKKEGFFLHFIAYLYKEHTQETKLQASFPLQEIRTVIHKVDEIN